MKKPERPSNDIAPPTSNQDMEPKRRLLLQILALAVALFVLAFVVSRGGSSPKPAAAPEPTVDPAMPTSPDAPASSAAVRPSTEKDYGVIGPATKANPHTIRRAVESLSEPAPTKATPAATPTGMP